MAAGEFGKAFAGGLGGGLGAALPGMALGAISLPFQIAQANRQREFQKSATEAQLKAAQFATEQSAANQMMGLYAQLGENLGSRVFGSTVAPDLERTRQFLSRKEEADIFAPKDMALGYERLKRAQDLATSQAAKDEMFQNLLDYKRRKGFDIAAQGEAMFGPTSFSRRFTNV
jgi:hypothetical protein